MTNKTIARMVIIMLLISFMMLLLQCYFPNNMRSCISVRHIIFQLNPFDYYILYDDFEIHFIYINTSFIFNYCITCGFVRRCYYIRLNDITTMCWWFCWKSEKLLYLYNSSIKESHATKIHIKFNWTQNQTTA
jgi:hypothetical protein